MSCSAWSIIGDISAIWTAASITAAAGFHHSYRLVRVRYGEVWFYCAAFALFGAWIGGIAWVLISCARA
jgi:hypothetical protein